MPTELRALLPADVEAADAVLRAAYGGGSRRDRLERYLALQPDGWLLAEAEGEVAGVAGTMHYGPLAYIGLVGVSPAFRRRGIALALMQRLLAWLAERGDPVVVLEASPSGAPLYEQLGFVDDGHTISFEFEGPPRQHPPAPGVQPLARADLPEIAAFDAPIFGAARQPVFELLLREEPARAFVLRDDAGACAGFLFAQSDKLGPWAAATPAAAEALLTSALALRYTAGPYVLAPATNPHIAPLLARHGFVAVRALRHMHRGGARSPGRAELLYGRASFAIG